MFTIQGKAMFTEADMYIGEKLCETLKNEGFAVNKEYLLQKPTLLVLHFNVEKTDENKAETLFKIE